MIELVMTMVIVAILAVSAVPRFFSTQQYQKNLFAKELAGSIRYARKLAVATGARIQLSLSANTLTLSRRVEGSSCQVGTTFVPIFDPTTNGSGYTRPAPGDLTVTTSSDWPLYFDTLGRVHRASDCSVIDSQTISISDGKTVTIFGETGFVE